MIYGVGLILHNPTGHILVIRELVAKPEIEKEAGMLSIPLETTNDGEDSYMTLIRLLIEEVGRNLTIRDVRHFKTFTVKDTEIRCYTGFCDHAKSEFNPTSDDVEIVGWMTPRGLLQQRVRREVPPILNAYLQLQSDSIAGG